MKQVNKLEHALFYGGSLSPAKLFPDEYRLYTNDAKGSLPWSQPENYLTELVQEWGILEAQLTEAFNEKDYSKIKRLMIESIALYLKLLFWSNKRPVQLNPLLLDDLMIKPMNHDDRLNFLLQRPYLYHSFVQLGELIVEQQKAFYRELAKKRAAQ